VCLLLANSSTLGSGTYTYDGNGLRVKKVSGGTTTVYVFSGSKVIAEYVNGVAPGSPTREYIYSGGMLAAKIEGGVTQYYHQDHLSVRMLTNSSGVKIGDQGHFPYGESWYAVSTTTKWQYTSYERDAESGNDYAMARYYVNRLGRMSSPDLIAGSQNDPQSLNRYTYVGNDPINSVDPSGLFKSNPGEGGSIPGEMYGPRDCIPLMYRRPNPFDAEYSDIHWEDVLSTMCVPPARALTSQTGGTSGRGHKGSGKGSNPKPLLDPKSRCARLFEKLLGVSADRFNAAAREIPWYYSPNGLTLGTMKWDFIAQNNDQRFINVTGKYAVTAAPGGPRPAPVVLGPNWFTESPADERATQLHEAVHSITGKGDSEVFSIFAQYGLPSDEYRLLGNTHEFSEWLKNGCPP
jgi:RHS repeat-associated protein